MSEIDKNEPTSCNAVPNITTDEARTRLTETIHDAVRTETNSLIQALTSMGKSYTVATTPWRDYPEITGGKPVFHISPTTNAREEAEEKSKKAGLDYHVLEGRDDACSVAQGEHDDDLPRIEGRKASDWLSYKCDVQRVPFSEAHRHLSSECGGLPCGEDGRCDSRSQWDFLRTEDRDGRLDYDVIHMTANFARLSGTGLLNDANIFFDECPDYQLQIDHETIRRVGNQTLLERTNGRSWDGLIDAVRMEDHETINLYREQVGDLSNHDWSLEDKEIYTPIPMLIQALIRAEPAGNGLFLGEYGDYRIVVDSENTIKSVYHTPDLSHTRCIVGLDAHPSSHRWKLNINQDLVKVNVLSEPESKHWRIHERGLHVVKIGGSDRSLTQGWRSESVEDRARLLIRDLRDRYGDTFRTCICPLAVKKQVEKMMVDAGVDSPTVLHYGSLKSRNTFADESVGLVLGCIDPGDHGVSEMLALSGLNAEPETYRTEGVEEMRAWGRGFVGRDHDAANELLESVRADGVAQAVGRYARDPDNPDSGATVYVWSDTVPDELVDEQISDVERSLLGKKRLVAEALVNADCKLTTKKLAEQADCSKEHVRGLMADWESEGLVTKSSGTGPYNADEFSTDCGSIGEFAGLKLNPPTILL